MGGHEFRIGQHLRIGSIRLGSLFTQRLPFLGFVAASPELLRGSDLLETLLLFGLESNYITGETQFKIKQNFVRFN